MRCFRDRFWFIAEKSANFNTLLLICEKNSSVPNYKKHLIDDSNSYLVDKVICKRGEKMGKVIREKTLFIGEICKKFLF